MPGSGKLSITSCTSLRNSALRTSLSTMSCSPACGMESKNLLMSSFNTQPVVPYLRMCLCSRHLRRLAAKDVPLPSWHAELSRMLPLVRSSYSPLLHMARCTMRSRSFGAFICLRFGSVTSNTVYPPSLYVPPSSCLLSFRQLAAMRLECTQQATDRFQRIPLAHSSDASMRSSNSMLLDMMQNKKPPCIGAPAMQGRRHRRLLFATREDGPDTAPNACLGWYAAFGGHEAGLLVRDFIRPCPAGTRSCCSNCCYWSCR